VPLALAGSAREGSAQVSFSFSLSRERKKERKRENSLLPFAAVAAALFYVLPCCILQEHMVWLIGAKAVPAQQLPCFCPPASADAPRRGPPRTFFLPGCNSPNASLFPRCCMQTAKVCHIGLLRDLRKSAIADKIVEYFSYSLLVWNIFDDDDIFSSMLLKLFSI